MKLDRYDIAMVNAACKQDETARPMLQCLHFTKGRVEAADGFMLATRDLDLQDGEEKPEALLNTKMIKQIKPARRQETILQITDKRATVSYQDEEGKPVEFEPSISFATFDATFPDTDQLWTSLEKKAQIAISVSLLKKLIACLPDGVGSILRIGITEPTAPLEFECSNMDRPIRGMIMPMHVDWKEHKWKREKKGGIKP
uniref:DNA polymerase n=1 Tax=viral metagenome TaxID=1070528 RepID=A0A6M3J334_9ZZZZ